jgi:hypothetical protein
MHLYLNWCYHFMFYSVTVSINRIARLLRWMGLSNINKLRLYGIEIFSFFSTKDAAGWSVNLS